MLRVQFGISGSSAPREGVSKLLSGKVRGSSGPHFRVDRLRNLRYRLFRRCELRRQRRVYLAGLLRSGSYGSGLRRCSRNGERRNGSSPDVADNLRDTLSKAGSDVL